MLFRPFGAETNIALCPVASLRSAHRLPSHRAFGAKSTTRDADPMRQPKEKRATSCEMTRSSRTEILVRLAGIEPTTPWFVAKYSIQLSYSREALHYSMVR